MNRHGKTFISGALTLALASALALALHVGARAQAGPGLRTTLELQAGQSRLNAGLPSGSSAEARLVWQRTPQQLWRVDLLDERKFGSHGGILSLGHTRELSPDWIVSASLAAGQGGANWAKRRVDLEISTKWLPQRNLLTRVALYHAAFDNARSDQGLRLAVVGYLPADLVAEAGLIANTSQPGRVHSAMPFASLTWGREGEQYLALRLASGREAWQAVGAAQLVDFRSRSLNLSWRRWLFDDVGLLLQGEHYRNPSYRRNSLGAGLFYQW